MPLIIVATITTTLAQVELLEEISQNVICIRCAGADINMAGSTDKVLPMHAASSSSKRSVKEIITMNPKKLSSKEIKHGGTPLHWAQSKEVIEMLLEVNTNIDAKNFKGKIFLLINIKRNQCNRV